MAETDKQTMGFQTEVKQILQLMIHSLYSNKEIFLRELISNASDAIDRLRYESLDKPELMAGDTDFKIMVSFDREARTITISDNGIGMTREEAVNNLGTIAKSGTKEFLAQLSADQKKNDALIGQFGVGFYSGFIVADSITVISRKAGLPADQAVRWESDGTGSFSVETVEKATRGTDIILHLREGEDSFLNNWELQNIIRKYSDHISLPIQMPKEEWDPEAKESKTTNEFVTVNQANALWARSKSEITDEQYKEFYKHVSHDFNDPLTWTHNKVEGRTEYTQLLYIPKEAPMNLWDRTQRNGLKLYVKRVFIMEDVEQLLPFYLRFVRGIIDSNDLPLNVSREILQESRDVRMIKEGSTRRVLSMLEELATSDDPAKKEQYKTFWEQFGKVLKEGIAEDPSNKERIAKLLRFASTHNDSDVQDVSLDDYISRMKEGQVRIFYIAAENYNAAKNSPHLEIFRKKGVEVLIMTDRVDEWMLSFLNEYQEKNLVSVTQGSLDLLKLADEEEQKQNEENQADYKETIEKMKKVLEGKAKDVRTTVRLTDSPCCLVADEKDMSSNLQRMLKAAGQNVRATQPILEINPTHPLVQRLKYETERFDDWTNLLFGQAVLAEGGALENPAEYVKLMNNLLLGK